MAEQHEQHPRTYTLIELVGTSPTSYAEATKNAIERAGETLRGLGWFEVTQLRGLIDEGRIAEYQVTVKVGFQVLDHDPRKLPSTPQLPARRCRTAYMPQDEVGGQ